MDDKKKESSVKGFSMLSAFSLFEKAIAFVFQAVIAAVLGAGLVTDCYFSASQLFDLIDVTLLGALVVSLINRYTHISEKEGEEKAFAFLTNINSWATIVMIVIVVIVFVFARPFSYLIAPGFEAAGRDDLVTCIRILALIPVMAVLNSISQAILRQKKHFLAANSRSLFISLCGMGAVIVLAVTKDVTNTYALCIAYLVSNLLFTILVFVKTRTYGKLGYCRPLMNSEVKGLVRMVVPTIISNGVHRVSLIIDQILSSMNGPGAITCLTYAHSLYNIVGTLLIVNLGIVLLTDFTKHYVRNEMDALVIRLRSSTGSIMLLLVPITVLCVIFAPEIVAIIYQRGAFDAYSTQRVANLLMFYTIGFIPAMLNNVYTQVLYAFGKMNTAMRNSLIALCSNIVLSIVLERFIGLMGIAIGTTISVVIATFFFKQSVSKLIPEYTHIFSRGFIWHLLLSLAIALVAALAVKLFIMNDILSFASATVLVFAVFFGVMFLLKDDMVQQWVNLVRRRVKR